MLKKFIQSALLLVVLFTTVHSYAQVSQAPDGIQFQALATDANGRPAAGRVIYVRDAIIAKSATGSIVYSETFKVTASSAGIFTIVLGKGTYASGVTSIANIDWSNGPFFLNLKIAVEPTVPNAGWNVNNEYVDLGTSQFWSVPYALYAGNVRGADGKLNTSDTAAMLKSYFTAINFKANTADVNISLALKANTSDVTTALATKVDKVTGKELSTNDYTTAEKTKLAAITGTNTGDQDLSALATNAALALKANTSDLNTALATKVDKVTGKELSTNDYTTAEKAKLAAITGTNSGDQDLSALATNTALATKVDKVTGKALSTNDYTTAEKTKLAAIIGTNTGDQDLSSLATNTALALKANTTDVTTSLATKVDKVAGKELSTNDYTTAEKTKLAAISGTNTGDQINITGNAATATKLGTARKINGVDFDGSGDITVTSSADAGTLTGTTLKSTVTNSSLTSVGTLTNLTVTNPITGSVTGNAATATKLETARKINGVDFDGTGDITVTATADAGTLTGTTLKSTVTNSSLTSVGTLTNLTRTKPIVGRRTGKAATATTAGNITATANTTLTSLSNLATVGTITSGVWSGTAVAVEKGGTGATTASAARTNLGLVIGTNVQAPLIAGTDYLVPTGSAASLTNFPTFNQNTTGNAATATTAGNITATTNTTLTSLSNLATVGTITSGVWSGTAVAVEKGGTGLTSAGTNGQVLTSNGNGALYWTTPSTTATAYSGVLPLANGGTGETSISGIKSALGLLSNNVAIGSEAGTPGQGVNSNTIAIGGGAGRGNQGQSSIAIGYVSGDQNQGANSISIGGNAAQAGQGSQAVAIGYAAGQNSQGANAVAIGTFAGQSGQAANSIAINATGTGTPLNPQNSGLFVDPIRSTTATTNLLFYNTTSKEITAATGNGSFVDLTTSQTIAGTKTFSSDITINGKAIVGASSAASASAVLEVSSTTQGFLPPRMTFAQRNLISNPATGLIIFCSDCGFYGEPQFYDGIDNWRKFDQNIGSNNTGTINIVVDALEEPTNAIGGPLGGQSFTTSSAGKLVKIVTSAIGGVDGTQLTNGIASSYLNIRRWVNDNETTNPNALSGEILATSNTNPTILNYYSPIFPITEFTFPNQIVLSANTKYVIEFVYGNGVYLYVKITGTNGNGQAYDTGGENNLSVRDFPIQVYLKQF
jgi:hypothetical protein